MLLGTRWLEILLTPTRSSVSELWYAATPQANLVIFLTCSQVYGYTIYQQRITMIKQRYPGKAFLSA